MSKSLDFAQRWTAAIGLSEIHTLESAQILFMLQSDEQEIVRTASKSSLSAMPASIRLALEKSLAVSGASVDFIPNVWKTKPLAPYTASLKHDYQNVVLDIISTEGPTCASRIRRLLGGASLTGSGFTAHKCKQVLDPMLASGLIYRVDRHPLEANFEFLILSQKALPEFVIRKRNDRQLTEIPVNEARAVLMQNIKYQRKPDKEVGFQVLCMHYEIQQNEFFLVGEALEGQWLGLFD